MGADGMIEMVGKEWAIIQLGHPCHAESLIVDTNHYKGNFPESCLIEYAASVEKPKERDWKVLLKRTKLGPHQEHLFSSKDLSVKKSDSIAWLRVTQYPDGGISRIRLFASKANIKALL